MSLPPELTKLSVYIDANVLFSASHKLESEFLDLWRLRNVFPVTSAYAVDEVSRNLRSIEHRERFEALLRRTGFVSDADPLIIPGSIRLVEKDRPILAAAIAGSVEYLVTGDVHHFGTLFNSSVAHVTILRPTEFLRLHRDRLID
jgi:predicted nucleic acid-binding protein